MSEHEPSILLRQPYDIRNAIYNQLVLPPFHSHQDYAGLQLTCHQLHDEVKEESASQFKIFIKRMQGQLAAVGMTFLDPPDTFHRQSINIEMMFELSEGDWYRGIDIDDTYRCLELRHFLEWDRPHWISFQRNHKWEKVDVLDALTPLFALPFEGIRIHLKICDETAAALEHDENLLTRDSFASPERYHLSGTRLGVLLASLMEALAYICENMLRASMFESSLEVGRANIEWDFRHDHDNGTAELKEETARASYPGLLQQHLFTQDGRVGKGIFHMDVAEHRRWKERQEMRRLTIRKRISESCEAICAQYASDFEE